MSCHVRLAGATANLVLRAVLPIDEKRRPAAKADRQSRNAPRLAPAEIKALPRAVQEPNLIEVTRPLRGLHLLLRSARLYERQHPRLLQSLDGAYESIRAVAESLNGFEVRVERSGLVVPKVSDSPLPDGRGDLYELAKDLQRAAINNLVFAQKFHVG